MGDARTILIADDDEMVRRLATRLLSSEGYLVLTAEDGAAAVEVFRAHPEVAIVILDALMPRMNGAQACAEILRIRPVPIVFASGSSGGPTDVPGATAFLEKPFEPDALFDLLAKLAPQARSA